MILNDWLNGFDSYMDEVAKIIAKIEGKAYTQNNVRQTNTSLEALHREFKANLPLLPEVFITVDLEGNFITRVGPGRYND